MATFSPSDVAFEGFRLSREKPKTLLIWAVASFLGALVTLPLLIASGLGRALALAEADGAATGQALAVLMQGGPAYLLMMALGLVLQSVFVTAVYRAVLRPADSRFGYLRLGMDEMRQVILFLILMVILMVAVFVIVLFGGVIGAVANGLLDAAGPAGQAISGLVALGIAVWVLGLVVYVAVRLSLSLPMTFDAGHLRVLASWRLTKGHFWRLTAAYFLAGVLFFVVWLLALIVFCAAAAVIGAMQGLSLAEAMEPFKADTTSVAAYFTLPTMIYALFSAVMSAIYYAVTVSPSAMAYQALAHGDETAAAEAEA